jgi:hypothetical protein
MSKCNFNLPFSVDAESMLSKIKSAIEKQGGVFTGDQVAGNFNVNVLGNITGSYIITGQVMHIDISSSPMFIPCSQIESFMKSQLSK